MEINMITDEKTKLEFELVNEDHTFCNVIRKELWNNEDVNSAAYRIHHPLVSQPVILIETQKSDAKKALITSIESLRKKVAELKTTFSKTLK